jgi:uncharacterized protein (TIGR00369 family)
MEDLEPRRVASSQVTLVQLMEITDANIAGIVHGGVIMKLVDTAAGLAAFKHAGGMCVTVSMDEMSFLAPSHVGDTVTVKASVNDVGTTSLEIGVRVESGHEDPHLQRVPRVRRARRRGQAETGPTAGRRDRGGATPSARGKDPARDEDRAP